METVADFIFLGSKINEDGDCSHKMKRCLLLGKKAMTNLHSILKSREVFCQQKKITFLFGQSYGFSNSHVWMWALDHNEVWELKNWCFWILVLEKLLESLLNCKDIKPVNSEGNQPWIFIGRIDAESSILWPPDVKSWLAGKDWG